MQLVDIKSRLKRNFTVNLSLSDHGLTPGLTATTVKRSVAMKDKKSGGMKYKETSIRCPPSVTFRAGETEEGLPETVLKNSVIARMLKRRPGKQPELRVTKQYDAPKSPVNPKLAAAKAAKAASEASEKAAPEASTKTASKPKSKTTPKRSRKTRDN